jgi:hypothetical protein
MTLPRMDEIETLPTPERIYLVNLQQALGVFASRIPSTVPDDIVDAELIARATVTIFLAIAARCAIDVGKQQSMSITQSEFALLAKDSLRWARKKPSTLN